MDIGLIGLGVMGENLASNFIRNGFSVAGFDRSHERSAHFSRMTADRTACSTSTLPELVGRLQRPRRIMMMVPAGAAVDAVIEELEGLLEAGDILVDGGNSHYADTERRQSRMRAAGVLYLGVGVSGGERGALLGPALMPGGAIEAWHAVAPLFEAIAARAEDGVPCCQWMGSGGAGHFVKMVHNGIEYADMQALCEAYAVMQLGLGMTAPEIGDVFAQWNQGELSSYLTSITSTILRQADPESGAPLVDLILDTAEQKGTGKWASQAALDLGVPAPTMTEAVFARALSALREQRQAAATILTGPTGAAAHDRRSLIAQLEGALIATRIMAYAQGFALLKSADSEFDWGIPLAGVAATWRAGCIIRARLLEDIRTAFAEDPGLSHLLLAPRLAARMSGAQIELRQLVAWCALRAIPIPAFMSALGYYDAYRSRRLPANLLQAQRDCFGAHGYQRTDRPGWFHTRWPD